MLWLLLWLLALPAALTPTPANTPPRFQPVSETRFAGEDGFRSGWFTLSADGSQAAAVTKDGRVGVFSVDGSYQFVMAHEDFATATWAGADLIAAFTEADSLILITWDGTQTTEQVIAGGGGFYAAEMWADADTVSLQMMAGDGTIQVWDVDRAAGRLRSILPFAPASDETAVVQIGRISAPYSLTSSQAGDVHLWNWVTGKQLIAATNGVGIPSVFGNINASADDLVWRDNDSETLYLLAMRTNVNQVIAPLNGDYVQWFFVTPTADQIIGVNVGFQPNVVAWDVVSGQREELGQYLACERPQPDMARLSEDGSTLVIGCDGGLQFWQIENN